ncbi:hypothetical protein RIF29_02014 [Crotalaria pallida]|uniref:Uncharacterized protein n=1 Tax=Crotalaria pallida TaxID=3830 RepID=A0AAN9IZA8_CROPI
MGNRFSCMTKKESQKDVGSRSKRMGSRSQRKLVAEEDLHLQALSMAIQQHQLSQSSEVVLCDSGSNVVCRSVFCHLKREGKMLIVFQGHNSRQYVSDGNFETLSQGNGLLPHMMPNSLTSLHFHAKKKNKSKEIPKAISCNAISKDNMSSFLFGSRVVVEEGDC